MVAPVLAYFATNYQLGYAIPMLIGTIAAGASFVIAIIIGPETKGVHLVSDVVLAPGVQPLARTGTGD